MDIFNQVRISRVDDFGKVEPSKVVNVENLMIRIRHDNGHVMLAERTADDHEGDWFQFSGWVIGTVDVDEYGIVFECVIDRNHFSSRHKVVVTRQGVYSE